MTKTFVLKTLESVEPELGGKFPVSNSQLHHERSGSGRTPSSHASYWAKLLLLISPNLLLMVPLRAKLEAKRAARTITDVVFFILY